MLYENYYDCEQIIILSASSKTAIGLAQGLSEADTAPKVFGFTSKKNKEFVESLNCYDEILPYEEIDNLDFSKKFSHCGYGRKSSNNGKAFNPPAR